ncbi:Phenylalanine--tRNA ligase alpha subunit [Capsicum annuum]|nr:Phenylalanine--tRNA ligase alpha subunit [Capsicum annuum]
MAEEAILAYLEKEEEISNSENFAQQFGFSHEEILNVIRRLHGFKFVEAKDIRRERWVLTEEGETYAAVGSPEFQLFSAVPPEGIIALEELQKKLDPAVYKIGWQQALKNKWVQMKTDVPMKDVSRKVQPADDKVKDLLLRIQNNEGLERKFRKKRSQIRPDKEKSRYRSYSGKFTEVELPGGLAPKVVGGVTGRNWNLKSTTSVPKVRRQVQTIFLNMGFEEMPTNNYVESSFWNFDALFQPQQHPARDSHDTFFLKVPSTTKMLPEDYVERVKEIHESGGYQSRGYGYDWKREEANKNLLRTHTTAVSSRMLFALAQKPFAPKKYYSIDRVFRNEAVDRTHLAEFHQIEGLICDRGLTLGDLIGVLHDFFSRLGMSKLRFKPAYNPYTEPSMEIFSYHEGFKKWVEVGNSGMFRPEMLLPMGLPEDVRVIAWGLSLERPTMILYGIDNIRDLFGSKVDLSLIKRNPICRLGL